MAGDGPQEGYAEGRPVVPLGDGEVIDEAGEASRLVHRGSRHEPADDEPGKPAGTPGHQEEVVLGAHQPVQVRAVPIERVLGLPPEQGLLQLVLPSPGVGKSSRRIDIVMSSSYGGGSIHVPHPDATLLPQASGGTSQGPGPGLPNEVPSLGRIALTAPRNVPGSARPASTPVAHGAPSARRLRSLLASGCHRRRDGSRGRRTAALGSRGGAASG